MQGACTAEEENRPDAYRKKLPPTSYRQQLLFLRSSQREVMMSKMAKLSPGYNQQPSNGLITVSVHCECVRVRVCAYTSYVFNPDKVIKSFGALGGSQLLQNRCDLQEPCSLIFKQAYQLNAFQCQCLCGQCEKCSENVITHRDLTTPRNKNQSFIKAIINVLNASNTHLQYIIHIVL